MNCFPTGLWHVMKSGFYLTTSNDQLSGWTEKKPQSTSQSQTCTKIRSWSLFGGLLPIWPTTAFWVPVKWLHLKNMLSKLMRYTENCNACKLALANKWAQFFSMTVPTACNTSNSSKVGQIGYKVFPHSPCSPELLPIDYHFFKHFDDFLQGKCFHNQKEAGNASQELVEYWSMDFCATGMNLFLIGQNVLLVMFPILMNKDVFEL